MTAAVVRRHDRAAAVAILAAATLLAAWIILHRPPQIPVRIAEPKESAPEKPPPTPPAPAQSAMNFEIVELPPLPAPAPPPPQPVQTARAETPPVQSAPPPPEKAAEKAPEKPVTPLTVEAPPPAAKPAVAPLQPEAKPQASIVLLQAEPESDAPAPQAKPLQLLRPSDDTPTAQAVPVQALQPEPEKPVSRETKPVLALEPPRPPSPPKPAPKAEPKPEPFKAPAPPAPMIHVEAAPAPAAAKPVAAKEVATEGRVLLRMFEQGAGPSIEIRWPAQASERDRLFDVFTQCLGMKVGLIDDQGHVYLGEGPRTQAMALNMDKYSGFVRRPEGAIATDEQQEIARIRAYHGVAAPPARMFPRRVDAYLLGGLRAAVGDQYLKMKFVHATYRLSGRRVVIDTISADGRAVDGAIDLSTVAACS